MFRKYKVFKRYQTIAGVLLRHGFVEFVEKSRLTRYLVFRKKALRDVKKLREPEHKLTIWQKIRCIIEELGPTFVKLGQFVSDRPDLLPQELCDELKNLLDSVAPFDSKDAIRCVEKELQCPIDEVFREFSELPISSASIGQVHKAVLYDGTEVAVKIQRPNIEKIIEADLDIMANLAALIEKYAPNLKILNLKGIVEEFKQAIKNELDFSIEANNIQRFAEYFERDKRIHVPKVFRQYSTRAVMTVEFIRGIKIKDIGTDKMSEEQITLICGRMVDLVLAQVFDYGFFHADPHMANIFVMENNVICFIDMGMMGSLMPKHKDLLASIVIGLAKRDPRRITHAVIKLSQGALLEHREELEYDVLKLMEKYSYLPLKDINIGKFLNELIKLVIKYRMSIPPDLLLLMKALLSIEGAARKLQPDFNMVAHIEPFARKLVFETMSPKRIFKDILEVASEYAELIYDLPNEIRELMGQLKNKNFKIQFEHKGLEPMLKKHDQISNRIAFSIITAALLIGSSLIMHAGIAPKLYGISFIGVITFIFSAVMGGILLITILKHGRM